MFAAFVSDIAVVPYGGRGEDTEFVFGRVYGPLGDLAAEPGSPGVETLADYGSFRLVRMSPADRATLRGRGVQVVDEPNLFLEAINGFVFDVRQGDTVVPRDLRTPPEGNGYILVHLLGPIQSSWRAALETTGATVLEYVPFYSYLVRATQEARATIASFPFVTWIGDYHPAYKIHPSLFAERGPVAARVVLFPDEDPEPAVSLLARGGYGRVERLGKGTGILHTSQAGDRAVLALRVDPAVLVSIAALRGVEYIEPVRPVQIWNANMQGIVQTNVTSPSPSRRVWDLGIRGEGQVVAVADTGLDFDHGMFRESAATIQSGDIYNVTDAARRKLVRYWPVGILTTGDTTWPAQGGDTWAIRDSPNTANGQTDCRFGHGTLAAGTGVGGDDGVGVSANDGGARSAKIFFEDIGTVRADPECGGGPSDVLAYLPDDLGELFRVPYEDPVAPARIHSNSWGSPGSTYDLMARQVDAFVWSHPDMLAVFSAGNSGPNATTIGVPATNKNGLAVGATNSPSNFGSPNSLFSFSSHGPTADGRMKPDLTAPGVGRSSNSDGNPRSNGNTAGEVLWRGTSYAAPAVAGAAALVRQYFIDGWYPAGSPFAQNGFGPTAALLKAVLVSSGARMTCGVLCGEDLNTYPNPAQGWGRVLLDDSLYFAGDARSLWLRDETQGTTTGESATYSIRVASSTTPLRIVLAWSDYPGLANANPALVNDLDLTVTDPSGTPYLGNVFGTYAEGQSRTGGSPDRVNTVEGVIRNAPAPGVWTLTVGGANVAFGPQPYAVVAVGAVDLGSGTVSVDRPQYGGGETIAVGVVDANAGSVSVRVASTSESAGEVLALAPTAAGSALWTGTIPSELGAPRPDGVLQVSDGDEITVTYADSAPAQTAIARARVDARGPAISNVRATDITDSSAILRWTTDEPAVTWAYYGAGRLDHLARATELSRTHAASLEGLRPETEYVYDLASLDRTGQRTTDDNGGRHYRFRTLPQADVLLVIGDSTFPEERAASYRRALAARGWTYATWHADARGVPSLTTLRPYTAVVWNPGIEQYPAVTPAAQDLLRAYVDGGGRLLFSSHDVAWDLCSGDGSAHTTAASCDWVRETLHASWQFDPGSFNILFGSAGNPVSGPYSGGVPYVPHREGGAGDEVDPIPAGGSTTVAWRDGGGNATPDDVAILWASGAPNGTAAPGCVWCGRPSRVASFFFELTGIEFATVASDARADILDRTLLWLLGRQRPDVVVTAPNGGEVVRGDTVLITWTRAAHDAAISSQVLWFSRTAGEAWSPIATLPGTATEYVWDIRGLPNGARYRVRVDVTDDRIPPFRASDASDEPFTLARPGGDVEGPRIDPGTLVAIPNPPRTGAAVRIDATADDANAGTTAIAGAEWFAQDTEPTPTQTGTGSPMEALVPPFDAPVEGVTSTTAPTWAPGPQCIWVHARDAAGNWGPFARHCLHVVPSSGDRTPPARAALTFAGLSGAGNADVSLMWSRAADDVAPPTPGGTTAYRIVRATAVDGPYVQIGSRIANGLASYAFVDIGAGDGAAAPWYFYRIRTVDAAGNFADSDRIGGRVTISLRAGLNALSIPLELPDPGTGRVFERVGLRGVWTYDACSGGWRSYVPGRPANDLLTLSAGSGLFANVSAAGGLTVAGRLPAVTATPLCAGWNLVGFPSVSTATIAQDAALRVRAIRVLASDPDAAPGLMTVADGRRLFVATQAFWVFVPSSAVWTVPGR